MPRKSTAHVVQMAVLACLAAAGLMFAPAVVSCPMRTVVRDALLPGHRLFDRVRRTVAFTSKRGPVVNEELEVLRRRIRIVERQLRRRDVQLALSHEELDRRMRFGTSPYEPTSASPLFVPQLLKARVMAADRFAGRITSLHLDLGGDQVQVDMPVIDGGELVIDQGKTSAVKTGQPVYAGLSVVGRISSAGRLASTVRLVTAKGYSGRAQLGRQSSRGLVLTVEGIIEGTGGPLCRLTGIPIIEPVRVGDEVYTGGRSEVLSEPMYYGRVVRAEITSDSRWEIRVRPAIGDHPPDSVVVLRESLNPVRVLGN